MLTNLWPHVTDVFQICSDSYRTGLDSLTQYSPHLIDCTKWSFCSEKIFFFIFKTSSAVRANWMASCKYLSLSVSVFLFLFVCLCLSLSQYLISLLWNNLIIKDQTKNLIIQIFNIKIFSFKWFNHGIGTFHGWFFQKLFRWTFGLEGNFGLLSEKLEINLSKVGIIYF